MKKLQILSVLLLLTVIIPIFSLAKADDSKGNMAQAKVENKEQRMEAQIVRASTTEKRLENRENNIERIRERIASSTASTSEKRMEQLNNRLEKQREQMNQVRERLLEKELKVMDVLGKIASKIQERISILEAKGLNMAAAKAKLAEASTKIEELSVAGDDLATLINTEVTEENKTTLFQEIKTAQANIRTLARATHALLVDTIKEITKVLPKNGQASTTATSTED